MPDEQVQVERFSSHRSGGHAGKLIPERFFYLRRLSASHDRKVQQY